jgi:hypothetical protein
MASRASGFLLGLLFTPEDFPQKFLQITQYYNEEDHTFSTEGAFLPLFSNRCLMKSVHSI